MRKTFGVVFTGILIGFSASAMAAQQPLRIRGTIESIHGDTLAVKGYDGKTADLMLESGTKYAWVVPSSLSDIKQGDFSAPRRPAPRTT